MQRFTTRKDMEGLTLRMVTWGKMLSEYEFRWRILEPVDGNGHEIASGEIESVDLTDWQLLTLRSPELGASPPRELELELSVSPDEQIEVPLGVPLYTPTSASGGAAEINGAPVKNGGVIGLYIQYR